MLRAQYDWIALGGRRSEVARCTLCGDGLILNSQAIPAFVTALREFESDHALCPDNTAGPARPDARAAWFLGPDTAISSLTIHFVFTGVPSPGADYGAPTDPAEFGSCYLLLDLFPEWLPQLANVSNLFPEWDPYVRRWADLAACYRRELSSGRFDGLHRLIKSLNR